MAIKVTGQNPTRAGELAGNRARETDTRSGTKTGRAEQTPQSGAASSVQSGLTTVKLKEAIRETPDVRSERVAQIRKQMAQGRYQVDADKLATKVLNASLREDLEKP